MDEQKNNERRVALVGLSLLAALSLAGLPPLLAIVLSFAVVFAAIPFITFVTGMLQLTMDADSFLYQILLCIPALMAFTVAASVCLRRRGLAVAGFLIQFVGPVLFFVSMVLETV